MPNAASSARAARTSGEGEVEARAECLRLRHGHVGVDGGNRLQDRRQQRRGVSRHPHVGPRIVRPVLRRVPLPEIEVRDRRRGFERAHEVEVLHHADDLDRRAVDRDPIPRGPTCRPQATRKGFVDDGDAGRIGSIALIELTPFDDRHAERMEVTLADVRASRSERAIGISCVSGELNRNRISHPAGQRRRIGGAGGDDAGDRLDAANRLTLKRPGALGAVGNQTRTQPEDDDR